MLKPDTKEGPIAYVENIRQSTSTSLDRLMVQANLVVQKDTPDFRYWRGWWCPRHPNVRNAADVRHLIGEYCRQHEGFIDQGVACVSSGDRAKVLFYANAVPASNCSGTATADVQILEPKPGREESEEYVRAVAAMGFVPTLVRNILADQKIRLEQQRVERELPQLTTRGTRVCRTEGRLTYVGFVDDVTPDRSKVRIEVKGTTNGFRPGGWQPGPIWAPPASWRVCE